jgi:hypothetical protein
MKEKTREFQQRSITIPTDIDEKLDILLSTTSSPNNKSALISRILKDFFEKDEFMKTSLNFDSDTMLVPLQLYKEVEGISQVAVNSRLEKGKIRIEKIGGTDFVIVDKDDIKNIYLQCAQLQLLLKEYGIQLVRIRERLDEQEKIVNDIKNGEI